MALLLPPKTVSLAVPQDTSASCPPEEIANASLSTPRLLPSITFCVLGGQEKVAG
jgi:hypothetical protein